MSDLDFIGVVQESIKSIEAVNPLFIHEKLISAQQKTWGALKTIRAELSEGMTEEDARKLALKVFQDLGVTKHWHRPYIRFGVGTTLTYNDPIQPEYHLKSGDAVYIDLGPVWPDPETGLAFEGDVGDTFAFGFNPDVERCAEAARILFNEARIEWKSKGLTGQQIYQFLNQQAQAMGYSLKESIEGHRIGDFPHHKYSKERLAQIQFHPSMSLWVLEVQIIDPSQKFGAFFEDIL